MVFIFFCFYRKSKEWIWLTQAIESGWEMWDMASIFNMQEPVSFLWVSQEWILINGNNTNIYWVGYELCKTVISPKLAWWYWWFWGTPWKYWFWTPVPKSSEFYSLEEKVLEFVFLMCSRWFLSLRKFWKHCFTQIQAYVWGLFLFLILHMKLLRLINLLKVPEPGGSRNKTWTRSCQTLYLEHLNFYPVSPWESTLTGIIHWGNPWNSRCFIYIILYHIIIMLFYTYVIYIYKCYNIGFLNFPYLITYPKHFRSRYYVPLISREV